MPATNASAFRPDANTFLTHVFGRGLQDEHYVVERYRSVDGGIRPAAGRQGPSPHPVAGDRPRASAPRATRS